MLEVSGDDRAKTGYFYRSHKRHSGAAGGNCKYVIFVGGKRGTVVTLSILFTSFACRKSKIIQDHEEI